MTDAAAAAAAAASPTLLLVLLLLLMRHDDDAEEEEERRLRPALIMPPCSKPLGFRRAPRSLAGWIRRLIGRSTGSVGRFVSVGGGVGVDAEQHISVS